jgi:thiol-disulfide isomerase/thioredoxin
MEVSPLRCFCQLENGNYTAQRFCSKCEWAGWLRNWFQVMKLTFDRLLYFIIFLVLAVYVGKYFYQLPQFGQGEKALDFQAETIAGQSFRLSDLRGQYVLLDFWGSWCAPCRQENPRWVQTQQNLHGAKFKKASGFQMVSIGIERNPENWRRAIESDGLNWPYHILDQASSLRFFNSPIAKLYKIRQVPTNYLINPRGQIVAVNISPDELFQRLNAERE